MGTSEFTNVLTNYAAVSRAEADDVIAMRDTYPYSQVLHALAARVSRDLHLFNAKQDLQLAAVYAADRIALKNIIENAPVIATSRPIAATVVAPAKSEISSEAGIDYAEQVIQDIEKLNQLRHNFELLFVDAETTSYQVSPSESLAAELHELQSDKSDQHKSKKERIIELAKAVSTDGVDSKDSTKPGRKKRKDSAEVLIDNIVSREELEIESETQKEQIQIIEQFIKSKPTISGTKDKNSATEDLSSIKTGDFNDAIISETLVEILLKQGKKEKALEVLRKLIWKFPQKKAYFASQIEELKK